MRSKGVPDADSREDLETVAEGVKKFGHQGPVIYKIDTESPLKAFRAALMTRCSPETRALAQEPPPGESASNGVIENGVKGFKAMYDMKVLHRDVKLANILIHFRGADQKMVMNKR